MARLQLRVTFFASAVLLAACGVDDPAQPALPDTSTVVDEDICDWWETGDLTVTVADAIMTPYGIVAVCEQPGASAHSLLLIDPATHTKRDLYGRMPFAIDEVQLADDSTLLLHGTSSADLFTVDLRDVVPATKRIMVTYETGTDWVMEPRVVGDSVYFVHIPGIAATTSTLEKVQLHGGNDQEPVVIAELPGMMNYVAEASEGIYVIGKAGNERELDLVDLASTPATVTKLRTRPTDAYDSMGFHREVAGRMLWQDNDQLLEMTGATATEIEPMAFPISILAKVIGDEIVQVPRYPTDPYQDVVAMNVTDGSVRRAPLTDYRSPHVIGMVGDDVWIYEASDTRWSSMVKSTLR